MYVSLNWLKDFVDIPDNTDPKILGDELTLKTAEVEKVINQAAKFDKMVVGQVIELHKHPNADKLYITKTSLDKETVQIVCGGENLYEGMYVAVAKIGAVVDWHGTGETMTMKRAKIRGEESEGMICAGSEIGINDSNEGPKDILDLSAMKANPGTPLAELFNKNDVIFEFDNKSLTHRPDLWGHYGIAREIAAITGQKFKELKPKVQIPDTGESIKVEVKDPRLCPRYCGLIINNITVKESPPWLQDRLKATEHGTHNNIVDVTNYVMTELGQPMHAFDKNYIKESIIVRTANNNEKIKTLDEKEQKLTEEMLIIADHEKPLAIAGVIGGEHSGITKNTTSIILEAANFNAANVRRTSTKIGTRTDSVQRFEKSLDPNLAKLAILRAAELILKIYPEAKIAGPITDIKNFSEKSLEIDLKIERIHSKIGIKIEKKEIKKILENLHFEVKEKDNETLFIKIPSFRATKDINIEDDLIEEIARIYGYENIPASLPKLATKLPEENTERFFKHRSRELFSYGLGFTEVYNYSFYGQKELKNCLMTEKSHLKLQNYLSEDQSHLRTSLIPNLLKNIQDNIRFFEKFKIYEIGRSYKEIGQTFPLEEKKISGAIILKGKNKDIFYEAKGSIEALFKKLNYKKFKTAKEVKNTPYAHPNMALTYLDKNGDTIAKVFMIHPSVAKNHNLEEQSIAIFDINFSKLMQVKKEEQRYKKISKFPKIEIDVSVLIDKNIEVAKIEKEIFKANTTLIKSSKLFDIYEGTNIDKDKKAIAYKVTLQSKDHTLTDKEMTEVQQKIFTNLEKIGGIIRGK